MASDDADERFPEFTGPREGIEAQRDVFVLAWTAPLAETDAAKDYRKPGRSGRG
jgi:hypothetical protein